MCRFVAYLGNDILLDNVLAKPTNSIIRQSLHARESSIPTNGDGFGLGWYNLSVSSEPALFTSVYPAWNDRNLLNLITKITSPCLFAHVRAASSGGVTLYNCHPFVHGKWMLMHNGGIYDFIAVKRHLRHLLDDDIYHWIQGETDSGHLFALFLQLAKGKDLSNSNTVIKVLEHTICEINNLVSQFCKHNVSFYNLCLTDGKRLFAMRYCTRKNRIPESLHYFVGDSHTFGSKTHSGHCVLVASEKLTDFSADWVNIPPGHLLLVEPGKKVQLLPLSLEPS